MHFNIFLNYTVLKIILKINFYYLHNPPFIRTAHEKNNSIVNIKIKF